MAEKGQDATSPFITSWKGKATVNSVEFLESFKKYDKDSKTILSIQFLCSYQHVAIVVICVMTLRNRLATPTRTSPCMWVHCMFCEYADLA